MGVLACNGLCLQRVRKARQGGRKEGKVGKKEGGRPLGPPPAAPTLEAITYTKSAEGEKRQQPKSASLSKPFFTMPGRLGASKTQRAQRDRTASNHTAPPYRS